MEHTGNLSLREPEEKDHYEFEANLSYKVSLRQAWIPQWDPISASSKTKQNSNKMQSPPSQTKQRHSDGVGAVTQEKRLSQELFLRASFTRRKSLVLYLSPIIDQSLEVTELQERIVTLGRAAFFSGGKLSERRGAESWLSAPSPG